MVNPNTMGKSKVRTYEPLLNRKPAGQVVATAPKPPVGGAMTAMSREPALNRIGLSPTVAPTTYTTKAMRDAKIQEEVDKQYGQIFGAGYGGAGVGGIQTPFQQTLGLLGSSGGGGGGGGMTAAQKAALLGAELDRDKFNYSKEQDAVALAKQQQALQQMQNQLNTGGYRGNIDKLLELISGMETTGQGNIQSAYDTSVGNIGQGYDAASGLMNTGYNAVDEYLRQNPNDPYANLTASTVNVTNPMEQFLQAYGVSSPDIQAQVAAEQLSANQGSNAYNDFVKMLSGASQQSDKSRLAEMLMARNMGNVGLGQQRAAYQSQAANQQQQAMQALQQQIAQARFEQESAAGNRQQDLINQIIAAGGNPNPPAAPQSPAGGGSLVSPDVLAQLQAELGGMNFGNIFG
jgi:Trp operon repressor